MAEPKARTNPLIIESSDQVSRSPLFECFPVPRNYGVPPGSQVERGRAWPAPAGAMRVKAFEVYRYDPDSRRNPRLDTFMVDLDACGPMVLDALIWIKNTVDSTLAFRRSCREGVCGSCAMNLDGTNWLACTRFITDLGTPARVYPLASRSIIKDLVPDLTHLFAQYEMIEPWLIRRRPSQPRSGRNRRTSAGNSTATTSASCAFVVPRAARAIGGTATAFSARQHSCRLGAG